MSTELARSAAKTAEVTALFAARVPILWVVSNDESWVKRCIFDAASARNLVTHFWDIASGSYDVKGKADGVLPQPDPDRGIVGSPDQPLDAIRKRTDDPSVWVLCDFAPYITGQTWAPVLRKLRTLADWLPKQPLGSIVILSTSADVPADLPEAKVIEWPLPDRTEIGALLDATVKRYSADSRFTVPSDEIRAAAVDAAIGLNAADAQTCFAKSIASLRLIDPKTISAEKERIVAKFGGIEWVPPLVGGFSAVGGNDVVKDWLAKRALAHTPAARAYGVPSPKGVGLTGVPGCGKSLLVGAGAAEQGVPHIRVDMGSLKGKFVGESEAKLRQAFDLIDTLGYCWVQIDEIEKALDGATSGSADGGVSADALGFLLTWMQERKSEAFVVVTANDASKLPPELLRKGRFDEVFWVGFPNREERKAVMAAALRKYNRSESVDLDQLADATEHFTGAEISELVPEALFTAFSDGARPITTNDLLAAARDVVPLYESRGAEMDKLQKSLKARPASRPAGAASPIVVGEGPVLDLS